MKWTSFLAVTFFCVTAAAPFDGTAAPSQKVKLRLGVERIRDAALRQQAAVALDDIAAAIGTLSNILLTEGEIENEIDWVSRVPLLLPPVAACQVSIGVAAPNGRRILRTVYAFDKGTEWRREPDGGLSVLVAYTDPVLHENVVQERQYYGFRDAHWRLLRQERFSYVLSSRRVAC